MTKNHQAALGRFKRVQDFLDEHTSELVEANRSHARVQLDEIVRDIDQRAVAQALATVQGRSYTKCVEELRENLLISHLRPIATIADAYLSDDRIITTLRMPGRYEPHTGLLAHARRTAAAVGAYRTVFLDEGLPDDFVERLVAAIEELRGMLEARERSWRERTQATEAIARLFTQGFERLRLLKALVLRRIRGEEALLAAWRSVSAAGCSPARSR